MPSTDSAGSTGSNDLHSVLAGLDLKPVQLDERARQQSALLAFGRRSNAQPPVAVLMEDAAAMVAEICRVDRIGVGEVDQDGAALSLKVGRIDKNGGLTDTSANRYALDSSLSMAGFALKSVSPVATADLASEKRFSDSFLRKIEVVAGLTDAASSQRQAVRRSGRLRRRAAAIRPRRRCSLPRRSPTC